MVRCQGGELLAPVAERCVSVNDQRVCALLDERRKGCIDLLCVARTYDMKLKPSLRAAVCRSFLSRSSFGLAGFTGRPITAALGYTSRILCHLIAPLAGPRK